LVDLHRVPLAEPALERKLPHLVPVVRLDGDNDHVVCHRHVGREDFDAQLLSQGGYLVRTLGRERPNLLVRRRTQVGRVLANDEVLQ
jgi:hypothetical protein